MDIKNYQFLFEEINNYQETLRTLLDKTDKIQFHNSEPITINFFATNGIVKGVYEKIYKQYPFLDFMFMTETHLLKEKLLSEDKFFIINIKEYADNILDILSFLKDRYVIIIYPEGFKDAPYIEKYLEQYSKHWSYVCLQDPEFYTRLFRRLIQQIKIDRKEKQDMFIREVVATV